MAENKYYHELKPVIENALLAFDDGKVSFGEVWQFFLTLTDAIRVLLVEVGDLSDQDLADVKEASAKLYDDYVLPLDMPGPDFIIDPLLRNGILPGLVEGAFRLAKAQLEGV